MSVKNELSRITIDISPELHRKLKAMAAIKSTSMRKMIIELIDKQLLLFGKTDECPYSHEPNKKTRQTFKNIEEKKKLIKAKNTKDLLKKLEI